MLAALNDTPYSIVLFLHILTALVAFAPVVAHSMLSSSMQKAGAPERSAVFGYIAENTMKIYGSALIVSGLLGFGVAGMSDKVYKMSQGWLVVAFLVWIAMNGVLHGMIRPAEKGVAAGDAGADKKLSMGGAILTGLFVIQLFLMVFKPGLDVALR